MYELDQGIEELKDSAKPIIEMIKRNCNQSASIKIRILHKQMNEFQRNEVSRIMKPCTHNIWKECRNPKNGVYFFPSLKFSVSKKTHTLHPPNKRVPKTGPRKICKAKAVAFNFDRLFRGDRFEKFKAHAKRQLLRIEIGKNVESFNPRYNRQLAARADNKDELMAEVRKEKEDALKNLMRIGIKP